MKKIFGLTLAALLVMSMVGGGTWAYFSDPEYASTNITAGTLDLKLNNTDYESGIPLQLLELTNRRPGHSGNVTVALKNAGSLPGLLTVTMTTTNTSAQTLGSTLEYADNSGDLGSVAEMAIFIDTNNDSILDAGEKGLIPNPGGAGTTYTDGTLRYYTFDNLTGTTWSDIYTMAAGDIDNFCVKWRIPLGTQGQYNNCQGDKVGVDVVIRLNQEQ